MEQSKSSLTLASDKSVLLKSHSITNIILLPKKIRLQPFDQSYPLYTSEQVLPDNVPKQNSHFQMY